MEEDIQNYSPSVMLHPVDRRRRSNLCNNTGKTLWPLSSSVFDLSKKFIPRYPPGTNNFPQKMSANSVQPFGQLELT